MFINIDGKEVLLSDLQKDVEAAELKGYGYTYAFTLHTVQGLIDKINELTKVPETTTVKKTEKIS